MGEQLSVISVVCMVIKALTARLGRANTQGLCPLAISATKPGTRLGSAPAKLPRKEANPAKHAGVKAGKPVKSVNWVATQGNENNLSGKINGESFTIAPDTGAEITIVPGHLVFERIRGVTGEPTLVQCARVPIEFEGHTFDKVVAVANKEMVSVQ